MRSWVLLVPIVGLALPGAARFPVGTSSIGAAQALAPKPATVQHVVVETTASATEVARGGTLTLFADVAPKPGIHVYAAGAPDVAPVTLAVTPAAGVRLRPVRYPEAEKVASLGALVPVPAYTKSFRIAQPVVLSSAFSPGDALVVTGTLTYQACDDRLCYPTASLPVRWSVTVR